MLLRAASIALQVMLPTALAAQDTILSVKGSDDTVIANFTLEQLDALEQTTFVTGNDFIDGEAEFSGPLVRTVLSEAAADLNPDAVMKIRAINEYAVDVPVADVANYDVIFATRMNGEEMSIRDKGPIWVMYPISDFPELTDGIYSSRLIWQVSSLELVE